MNLKIDKVLFDEKAYGGFEPTDPDDESFLANKLGKYPGDIPFQFDSSESDKIFLDQIAENTLEQIKKPEAELNQFPDIPTEDTALSDFQSDIEPKDETTDPKEGIPYPYEKSGIEKREREVRPYEKSGIEKEVREQIPFKKSGLETENLTENFEPKSQKKTAPSPVLQQEQVAKSIWDIFDEKPSEQQTEEVATDNLEALSEEIPAEIPQIDDVALETQKEAEQSEEKTQTILIGTDSIVDIPMEIKIEDISSEELSKIFDDDFRNTIIQDLEKSQKRKKKEPEPIISTAEKEVLQKELNKIEEAVPTPQEAVEIDISALDVEKPSHIIAKDLIESGELTTKKKKKLKKVKKEKKPQLPKDQPVPEKEELTPEPEPSIVEFEQTPIDEEKSEEERKKRKIPVFWFALVGSLLLFSLIIGGYFIFDNLFLSKEKPKVTPQKSITQKKEQTPKQEEQQIPTQQEPKDSKSPIPLDKEEKTENIAPKEVAKVEKPLIQNQPKTTEIKETPKTLPKPVPQPKEKIAVAPKTPTTYPKQIKLPQEVKIIETYQEEYSIEIYSTPDPDEASYWLNQLQQRGINAFQKTHLVRNIPYYKIRIGSYKTIDEAKKVARSLGFKNVWIDRMK